MESRKSNRENDEDPFKLGALKYGFGKKLCPGEELLSKRILLSKTGNKVYFMKRDFNKKADQLMSVELLQKKTDSINDNVELNIVKIFEMTESRVIYVDFDHLVEQMKPNAKDQFYILDSSKKIHRLTESTVVMEAGDGVGSFTKQAVHSIDHTVDLEEKLGTKTLNMMNIANIFSQKWPLYNITLRAVQHKNLTIGFDSDDKIIATLGEEYKAETVMALRGTAYVGGFVKQKSGAHIFFAKPNMGSRATDCLGTRGPIPTQTHIVGNGLIIFTWKDSQTGKDTTHIFNSSGRYHGKVLQPKHRQSKDPQERCDNMVPIMCSYDS